MMRPLYLALILLFVSPLRGDMSQACFQEYNAPLVLASVIIEVYDHEDHFKGIVLEKHENKEYVLPGTQIDYGEAIEKRLRYETKELTGLDLFQLKQFHVYSDPARYRDHLHIIDFVFTAESHSLPPSNKTDIEVFAIEDIPWGQIPVPQVQILKDYTLLRDQDQAS